MSDNRLTQLARLYGVGLTGFLLARPMLRDSALPPVALANSFLHLLLLPALPLLPLALLLRRGLLAVSLIAPVLEFRRAYSRPLLRLLKPSAHSAVHNPANSVVNRTTISLLTYNIHREPAEFAPMIAVIREANADVVAFQELSREAAECFAIEFAATYPHQAFHPQDDFPSAGQGVMSRYPIIADEYWRHAGIRNALGQQRVRLALDDNAAGSSAVTLYNIHPVHPGMVGKLFDSRPREQETIWLLERLRAESGPLVILGDFNMTDQSDDYERFVAQYIDLYREVGRGFGFTYPDWRAPQSRSVIKGLPLFFMHPLLRLDFVFCNAKVRPLELRTWPESGGSDHRPVFARVAV